jgi:hypothetical protein
VSEIKENALSFGALFDIRHPTPDSRFHQFIATGAALLLGFAPV